MAYSGTIGTTVIDVQKLIDHGARRCGKLAEELTAEQVLSARESLFFLLSHIANLGIQYWAIDKKVYGLNPDKAEYFLPIGSIDTLNVLYRTMERPTPNSTGSYASSAGGVVENAFDSNINTYTQQNAANGTISVDYGTANEVYVGSVGILPYVANKGSAIWNYVVEYSADGITWYELYDSVTTTVTDNEWIWHDVVLGQTVQYYRIRATGGTTLALREFYLGDTSREIPMARLNRDDYTNLPNKFFTANQPYQFWFNRTIPQPSVNLWPVPNDPFVQMVIWYSRQIMDVGDLSGELEIPQRWYEAVVFMLSHRMALELPAVADNRLTYLERMAEKYFFEAEQEERDKSPVYLAANISVYTK
jgi:hypothetical protein